MKDFFRLVFGLLIVVGIIGIGAIYFESFITEDTISAKVKKIEVIDGGTDGKYFLVHTDKEILENRDKTFQSKENINEINKKIIVGRVYQFKVVGYNFGIELPFFSKYRNIVKVEKEVKEERKRLRRLN